MPTNKALFLSVDFIRENTIIQDNVDDDLIETHILDSQNLRIEKVLGTALFNEITTEIIGDSVSADNKILLDDYIQPALKHWVVYTSLPYLNYQITNIGIISKQDDNSTSADIEVVNYLRNDARNNAEYMSQRMTDFLEQSCIDGKYPLYKDENNSDIDDIKKNKNNYFSGIVY